MPLCLNHSGLAFRIIFHLMHLRCDPRQGSFLMLPFFGYGRLILVLLPLDIFLYEPWVIRAPFLNSLSTVFRASLLMLSSASRTAPTSSLWGLSAQFAALIIKNMLPQTPRCFLLVMRLNRSSVSIYLAVISSELSVGLSRHIRAFQYVYVCLLTLLRHFSMVFAQFLPRIRKINVVSRTFVLFLCSPGSCRSSCIGLVSFAMWDLSPVSQSFLHFL